jgi:hypothetical protein
LAASHLAASMLAAPVAEVPVVAAAMIAALGGSPAAAERLAELCGRQPYAVRAMVARAAGMGWSVDELSAALSDQVGGGPWQRAGSSVTLALLLESDRACLTLTGPARRLFRLLSLVAHPLPVAAVAAIGGIQSDRAVRLLRELETA